MPAASTSRGQEEGAYQGAPNTGGGEKPALRTGPRRTRCQSRLERLKMSGGECRRRPDGSGAPCGRPEGGGPPAFHLRCFPTMRQDPSVNRAYCLSFSGSSLYSGASSAHVTSSSGDIPKSLPSGQSVITSRIPGRLGFPIRLHCVISATHLLHVASVA